MLSSFKYLVKEGFRNLWTNRLMSLASMGVLICCLLLMGCAALVSVNISNMMGYLTDKNAVMVFLNDNISGTDIQIAEQQLREINNINELEFISSDDAFLSIMNGMSDTQEILDTDVLGATSEFLPNAFKVTFKDISQFDTTIELIKQKSFVQHVSDKREFVTRLNNINKVVSVVGFWIVGLLFVVSLFIITNTIKLTMYVRKLEISIMKSVGATDWFIRLPFLVEGMIIGIISGVTSFGLIWYVYQTAAKAIKATFSTMGILSFGDLWWIVLLAFVGAGILAGAGGSLISISKYLKRDGGLNND